MLNQTTINEVKTMLAEVLKKDPHQVGPEMSLFADLEIASDELPKIESALAAKFNVKIESWDLWHLPGYISDRKLLIRGKPNFEARHLMRQSYVAIPDESLNMVFSLSGLHNELRVIDIAYCIEQKKFAGRT